jgi:hypothetical protein
MAQTRSFHGFALTRLATNLGLGLVPFLLFAILHPAIPYHQKAARGMCLALLIGTYLFFRIAVAPVVRFPRPIWHRLLSCLLLGSSLAAIPWKILGYPLAIAIISVGFSIRWILYATETWELRMEDARKAPSPCLATRIRRGITFITGALIPLLMLAGLPVIPLLILSFLLTAMCQWSAACETHVNSRPSCPG